VDQQRHSVKRVSMMLGAGCGAGARIGEQQDPMRRHKRVADDDILAAGSGQPADEPIVDDLAITDRQQEEGTLEGLPRTPIRGRLPSAGVIKAPSLTFGRHRWRTTRCRSAHIHHRLERCRWGQNGGRR
jgi:hypothetical protein